MSDGRTEKAKEDVLGKLSKDEMETIKHRRKFDSVERGTISYDLLVEIDPIGRQLKDATRELEHALVIIEQGVNGIKRKKVELASGEIKQTLKNGILMSEQELETDIKFDENKVNGLVDAVPIGLYDLRKHVGNKDYHGNEWLSLEEFEAICKRTEDRLNKLGYKLFPRRV